MAIVPANYKFRFKGQRDANMGPSVYVFEVTPRKKRVGLFKGELWLDAETCLPILEKGRLVKSPSLVVKRVNFERGYNIEQGMSVPEYLTSTIEARIVGRVELSVEYSNFAPGSDEDTGKSAPATVAEASE